MSGRGASSTRARPVAERFLTPPPPIVWDEIIDRGLREDLGAAGDLTTDAIVSEGAVAAARVVAREPGVIAGLDALERAFQRLDEQVCVVHRRHDGDRVLAGAVLAEVSGRARALLSAERTALNLLGRLSGIATATRRLVDAVSGSRAQPASGEPNADRAPRIACTRKTTPGLRALEKYAVRAGGGVNHRFGLDDAVLIKDNHIAQAGGIELALDRVRRRLGHLVKVEIEVDTLSQLERALAAGVDAVLLDNMSVDQLRQAVAMSGGRVILEASGGIDLEDLERVRAIAATGVDVLSVGALTHSARALDVGLDWSTPTASADA